MIRTITIHYINCDEPRCFEKATTSSLPPIPHGWKSERVFDRERDKWIDHVTCDKCLAKKKP